MAHSNRVAGWRQGGRHAGSCGAHLSSDRLLGQQRVVVTRTLAVTNGNYLAEDNLGRAQAQGKPQDGMPHFARAAEIEPSYVFAYIHMGIYLHQQGDSAGPHSNIKE